MIVNLKGDFGGVREIIIEALSSLATHQIRVSDDSSAPIAWSQSSPDKLHVGCDGTVDDITAIRHLFSRIGHCHVTLTEGPGKPPKITAFRNVLKLEPLET